MIITCFHVVPQGWAGCCTHASSFAGAAATKPQQDAVSRSASLSLCLPPSLTPCLSLSSSHSVIFFVSSSLSLFCFFLSLSLSLGPRTKQAYCGSRKLKQCRHAPSQAWERTPSSFNNSPLWGYPKYQAGNNRTKKPTPHKEPSCREPPSELHLQAPWRFRHSLLC